jgi:hypothetical protein
MEEFTGKDSNVEMTKLVRDKKVLEKRVIQLEQTSNNWINVQRDVVKRSTMTNFAKRTIMEQNLHQKGGKPNETVTSIGKMMRPVDEDFEPVRPTMENNSITP